MAVVRGPILLIAALLLALPVRGAEPLTVGIAYLGLARSRTAPLVALSPPVTDEGVQGARLALADNATTGRFLNQTYTLHEVLPPDAPGVLAAARTLLDAGERVIVLDLPAALLLQVADLPGAADAVLLDATSEDDSLRGTDCRRAVVHFLPSRAMLADALMQFLAVKRWRTLLLVQGPDPDDQAYADAMRRAARKFGLRLAADKPWTFEPGAQRTDTGHVAIGAEVARFTQGLSYDVVVVADTANTFGDDLAYRTSDPRPIAGTHGLQPAAWAPLFEQWGATQLQARFIKQAGRPMTARDFGAWMAVRAVGEAATRGATAEASAIGTYLHGPKFELAAYKGARLTIRPWDGQLRQPVPLMDTRSLVSVSPQPGFMHQFSELDTLGIDQPETSCKF